MAEIKKAQAAGFAEDSNAFAGGSSVKGTAAPNRGKRNSSLNIPYVIAAMAQIKGITEEEVRKAAWDNSLRLYHIEK